MKQDELELEKQCRAYARANGWACWKNEKNGCKGIPDDSFLSPHAEIFLLVEFKKDKRQKLRPEQQTWLDRYPNIVKVFSDFQTFKEYIDATNRACM